MAGDAVFYRGIACQRILLLTDFGEGPYVGQIQALLHAHLPAVPCLGLMQDLPVFRPDLAAYLLPALMRDLPDGSLWLCIVDPGVGGPRSGLLIQAEGHWLIGPDNGLLSQVARRTVLCRVWQIGWQPERMSASFHGRDWFAPAAVRLFQGEDLALTPWGPAKLIGADWPDERAAVIYIDHFGNLMTGLRADRLDPEAVLIAAGHRLQRARTFCEVAVGQAFWYENALGLVEIAVNQGRADQRLGLRLGEPIVIG
ncbi:SAM hydrolase/SAM-dependent halogenase family protein [Caldichromatium japonicum]|uniref:SAM hydrolase/SAM-dependent halogenase family protein n=1 Tax=Caldichromatium japonicum TaxID=2699430 RepID=UPI001FEBCFF6|nr:SAM-dependent chlorinase/fluorinase [Caldichromatium japonicum]